MIIIYFVMGLILFMFFALFVEVVYLAYLGLKAILITRQDIKDKQNKK